MNVWEMENIKGYVLDGNYVCPACIRNDEIAEVETMEIITKGDLEKSDRAVYCDRCKARL